LFHAQHFQSIEAKNWTRKAYSGHSGPALLACAAEFLHLRNTLAAGGAAI
jgi:hypothetical protein